jgi:hypothetical protein
MHGNGLNRLHFYRQLRINRMLLKKKRKTESTAIKRMRKKRKDFSMEFSKMTRKKNLLMRRKITANLKNQKVKIMVMTIMMTMIMMTITIQLSEAGKNSSLLMR